MAEDFKGVSLCGWDQRASFEIPSKCWWQVQKQTEIRYYDIQSISVYGIWSAKKRGAFCFLRPSWAVEIPLTIKVRLWVKSKIYV